MFCFVVIYCFVFFSLNNVFEDVYYLDFNFKEKVLKNENCFIIKLEENNFVQIFKLQSKCVDKLLN